MAGISAVKGDPRQGEDEHQQSDRDRLHSKHIDCHRSHIQSDSVDQTQVCSQNTNFPILQTHSATQVTTDTPPKKLFQN